ncbi:MAG: thioredoxin family protein [Anaerolineaceae bacterium]|nr:thioredoxin family protein [Anaerolineaceae bacterium]
MTPRKRIKKKKPSNKRNLIPSLLILGGVVILVVTVFMIKRESVEEPEVPQTLEMRLDTALQDKKPVFIFLHSLDCIPCKEMMEVVAQVHPDFQEEVELFDVDVYDKSNANILKREGLTAIPTLVFYNHEGERQVHIGVLPADQLHTTLQNLIKGN